MRKIKKNIFKIGYVFFFLQFSNILGREKNTKLEFIIKSYEYQNSLIKSILIKTKIYTQVDSPEIDFKNLPEDHIITLARQEKKEYEEEISEFKTKYKINKMRVEKRIYDKETGVIKIFGYSQEIPTRKIIFPPGLEGIVTTDKNIVMKYRMFKTPDIGPEILLFGLPILTRLKQDNLKFLETTQNLDGHSCYIIKGVCNTPFNNNEYEIWVDPNIGFMPRIIKEVISPGNFTLRKFLDYKEIYPEIWFPMKVVVEAVSEKDIKVPPQIVIPRVICNVYIVDSVKVNIDLPPDIFKLDFPSGTKVNDEITGTHFTIK